ncbi:galactokinase [Candidatus Wirthbacteria bacterium CG2_30_54_11]|uniref:Galactokinase n=1 Tax=Candidatus Wirthbacteria bacterium CG2_30_54_11 TaxID=1817892 RepID=A0A1J5IRK5_9BACT|nr:MAG: galactokinase [Candidatus Wirthbacteria bacterium CG2_30_54_11]
MLTDTDRLVKQFRGLFGAPPELEVRSPGRAEIIGNHTDYNHGFALAAAIEQHITALVRKRSDDRVRLFSTAFSRDGIQEFLLSASIDRDPLHPWTNYAKGVIIELLASGQRLSGADILLDSDLPGSGGVSSSAALELAIAHGMTAITGAALDPLKAALLCQRAENSFVGSPCGFLDQASIALGKAGNLVFLDFEPVGEFPISNHRLIPADLTRFGAKFVLAVDPQVKRVLGSSGYPARRKSCEDSLPFWSKHLGRTVRSLRDVTTTEFENFRDQLEAHDPVMRKRSEHIIYENARVLSAVSCLEHQDITGFGKLLTLSGESALHLYDLDEQMPELTYLFETGKVLPGVLGIRNMGGGFSALVLALVAESSFEKFEKDLAQAYLDRFGHQLDFLYFRASDGVTVEKVR